MRSRDVRGLHFLRNQRMCFLITLRMDLLHGRTDVCVMSTGLATNPQNLHTVLCTRLALRFNISLLICTPFKLCHTSELNLDCSLALYARDHASPLAATSASLSSQNFVFVIHKFLSFSCFNTNLPPFSLCAARVANTSLGPAKRSTSCPSRREPPRRAPDL
jgi:hypothetical protein